MRPRPLYYFVEVADDLVPRVVGSDYKPNVDRARNEFADKRYGKGGWAPRFDEVERVNYAVASDGRCLSCCAFPPAYIRPD